MPKTILIAVLVALVGCNRDDEAAPRETHVQTANEPSADPNPTPAPASAVDAPTVEPPAAPTPPPAAEEPLGLDNTRVIEIGECARELTASPERADAILAGHQLDRMTFEAAVAEIARDPWKSDLYIAVVTRPAQG